MKAISIKGTLIDFLGIIIIIHDTPILSTGILIVIYVNFLGINQNLLIII